MRKEKQTYKKRNIVTNYFTENLGKAQSTMTVITLIGSFARVVGKK